MLDFVVVAQVALPAAAITAARRAPHGELRLYTDVDHFDIYDGPDETQAHDSMATGTHQAARRQN
jgi:hypothetical protein